MTFGLPAASAAKVNGQPTRAASREGGELDSVELGPATAPVTGSTAAPRSDGSLAVDALSAPARNVLRNAADAGRFGRAESLEAELAQALAELEALKRTVFPAPAGEKAAKQALASVRADLDRLVGAYVDRERDLLAGLETAVSPAHAPLIQVQLVQFGRTKAHFEALQAQLGDFALPVGSNAGALGRLTQSLQALHGVVKRFAGAAPSDLPGLRVEAERALAQVRTPQRNLAHDSLTNLQFALLMDASRMLAAMHNRLLQLSREVGGTTERKMPADAQMHQLTQRYLDYARLFDALSDFRPNDRLSARQRQQTALALSQLHRELQRIRRSDSAPLDGLLEGVARLSLR